MCRKRKPSNSSDSSCLRLLLPLLQLLATTAVAALHSPASASASATNATGDIIAQFTLPNGSHFTHLVFDRRAGNYYAGASNRIYQLAPGDLSVRHAAHTGPIQDSPLCHAGGCPAGSDAAESAFGGDQLDGEGAAGAAEAEADAEAAAQGGAAASSGAGGELLAADGIETRETTNHNKILIVNQAADRLIACGSVRQGSCYIYPMATFPLAAEPVRIALAANDELASTFAFIGPARYAAWKREDILYVGTTFTNVGDYRHDVPAISSRKLDDLSYAEFSIQQSNLNIDVKYRDHFLVDYVFGFNSSEYAYFAVVQKKSHLAEEAGYVTRLARICVNDPNYDSYTEITIQCRVGGEGGGGGGGGGGTGRDYNVLRDAKIVPAGARLGAQMGVKRDEAVLVAVFSPAKEITSEPQAKSAMCIYSVREIEETFTENIHMCFNGTIKDRNLGYISGPINDGKCPVVGSIGNVFNFCSVGLKISGVSPIVAHSLVHFANESITSVCATTTGPHTLAFLGTADGHVKKVMLSGPAPGEYEHIAVDPGERILPDTQMSVRQDFLYVLSRRRLTKLRLEHCSQHATCSGCLDARDPFCGWCSLEKRCTVRSACQRDQSASRWLSLGTGQQCIDFEQIIPDRIPIGQQGGSVQLVIRTLPELPHNAKYRCVFGQAAPIDAQVLGDGLRCATPALAQRPAIAADADHVSVPLAVRSSETNKDFVARQFAFFDCGRHGTCRECVRAQWPCNWCVYDNRCVHNATGCRNTGAIIAADTACPHFAPLPRPILLPNKVPKEIKLEVRNMPRPQSAHTGFMCVVQIEGAHMSLPARVESNKWIVCERTPYAYEAAVNEYEARVEVKWNRNHYIDAVPITLYKCDVLGSHREHADCSLCVTREPRFQCAWCGAACVYNETCLGATAAAAGAGAVAVGGAQGECPRPRIDMIKPLSGPIEGGTLITIEGSNLGIRETDVRGKIRIGDIPCTLVNYQISVRIECRTGPVQRELIAAVKVGNDAGYTESAVQFHYKDVQLAGLDPQQGPQSGGTQLSIIGRFLNIGSSIAAYLDGYECAINVSQASSSRLTCVTSAARQPERIRVLTLSIDGANRTFTCGGGGQQQQQLEQSSTAASAASMRRNYVPRGGAATAESWCSVYNYTVDPRIMQIKPLKSFASGGRMVTVHGTNLDAIQKPEIEVYDDDMIRVNKSTCHVISANQMECPSPSVAGKFAEFRAQLDAINNGSGPPAPTSAAANGGSGGGSVSALASGGGGGGGSYQQLRRRRSAMPAPVAASQSQSIYTTMGYYYSSPPSAYAAYSSTAASSSSSAASYSSSTGGGGYSSSAAYSASAPTSPTTADMAALKIREPQLQLQIAFAMDNVQAVRDLPKHFQSLRSTLVYVPDPHFAAFPGGLKLYKGDTLVIEGERLNVASDESDVQVTIGTATCNVTSLAHTQLVCSPPDQQPAGTDELGTDAGGADDLPLVVVRVGRTLRFAVGHLRYDLLKPYAVSHALVGVAVAVAVIVVLLVVVLVVYRRKSTQAEREYRRIQIQMDTLESNVRMECKQAFAELQTDMTDLTADLADSGIPTLDHVNYIMKVFFPGVSDHPILNSPKMRLNTPRTNYDTAMVQFEQLINNKHFLLTFIETLEAQKSFNIRDKVNVASLLMIVLMNKMEYATDILKCLLLRLIDKSVLTKHPQLMLRRTESVVEKMLTNYMAICMYDYLKEYAGSSLFLLFKAIKHQIEKGLVDAITHDARYSLSEEKLLREQIEHAPVTLHIVQDDLDEKIQCKVLDCDSIAQVKSKILDALFKNTPFSLRPSVHEVDLEWRHGRGGHLTLQDEDLTTKTTATQWRRLNTLAHYGVKESAVMSLIARQNDGGQGASGPAYALPSYGTSGGLGGGGGTLHHSSGGGAVGGGQQQQQQHLGLGLPATLGGGGGAIGGIGGGGGGTVGKQAAAAAAAAASYHNCYYHLNNSQSHIIMNNGLDHLEQQVGGGIGGVGGGGGFAVGTHQHHSHHTASSHLAPARLYHLVKPLSADDRHLNAKNAAISAAAAASSAPQMAAAAVAAAAAAAAAASERTHKAIPEIFLTRLLATKGTIQKFVNDFFATILTVNEELPPAVKWLFDLLDEAAGRHGIGDAEIVHAWKSNSLPLRFWVNFIKNPDFIFDINKTATADACLSVIAQTFMDACSTTEHRLGKDSPSNKLLFAKDIPNYREMVRHFYREVALLPQISDQDMGTAMQQLSVQQNNEFDTIAALKELYIYVTKYREQVLDSLDADPHCKKGHLSHKLEIVACTLEGEETSAC